jgi:hypothetical protein
MKTILAMTLVLAALLGLTAWLAPDRPEPSPQRLFVRAQVATMGLKSVVAQTQTDVRTSRSFVWSSQTLLQQSPDRTYVKTTVPGRVTEVFTDGARSCVRQGAAWVPQGQPLASPGRDASNPIAAQDVQDLGRVTEDGVELRRLSARLSDDEMSRVGTNFTGVREATIDSVNVEYFVGVRDGFIHRAVFTLSFTVNGVRSNATYTARYSKHNEDVQLPDYVPGACTEPGRVL